MKHSILIAVFVITVVVVSVFVIEERNKPNEETKQPDAFLGITYCGNSVTEAKSLVDKVKDYTNLFVLQSPTLQRNFESVNDVGDYVVSKGLFYLPYFGTYIEPTFSNWIK